MKNKLTALAALLLIAYPCLSITQYDAESFYKTALTYFQANDFRNTLRSAHLAKGIFQELNYQDGVTRCNQLITQVDSLLTDGQMASAYYDIAGEYFLQDNPTIDSYTKAKTFAEYAKNFYNLAGDGEGVLRCDDMISRANSEINNMRNIKQEQAYTFYKMAQDSFFQGNYPAARKYAINASAIYTEISDHTGISRTASIIVSIDAKINETRYNALASYDRALDYYAQKDYKSALKYASTSQQLYSQIEDQDGMLKATSLVTRINTEYGQLNEQRLRLAQTYYDKAEEMLIIRDYVNATEYAKSSREIYMEFYNAAVLEEQGLASSEKVKTKLYSGYVRNVDNLIERINSEWGSEKKKEQAELFYTRAQEYYIEAQLESALNYAQRAKSYFTDLNEYIGVNKCDSLITSINNRMADKREADTNYEKAYSFYSTAEFESALLYVGKAKNLYVKILDTKNTEKVDNLTSMINDGILLRDQANTHYQKASGYFNAGDYENAKLYSQQAYEIYTDINYTLGIVSSQNILNQSNEKIHASYVQFRNTALIALAIIVVGGYLVVSKLKAKKKFTKEIEKEKDKFDREKKMKEREWAVRRDEETKEKVEEELRRLVEEERGHVGPGPETVEPSKPKVDAESIKKSEAESELRRLLAKEHESSEAGSKGEKQE